MKAGDIFEEQFTISDEVYGGFIQLFRDQNPLHTNESFATGKGFRGMVMHGNILNGFISYFVGECLPVKNVIIHSQDIQFKNAAYLNDVLKFNAVVNDVFDSVNAIEFKYDFKTSESKVIAKGKFQIGLLK